MSVEGTTRPSAGAVQRLARDVGGEVAGLRSALRRALDEADRLEAEGRPDRAAAVLAEQQQLLASVHRRLEERLADAAVEREAEGVLDAVEAPALDAAAAVGDGPATAGADGVRLGLRLLASAAAALVGIALLLAPDAGGTLSVAGSTSAEGGGTQQDAASSDDEAAHGSRSPARAADSERATPSTSDTSGRAAWASTSGSRQPPDQVTDGVQADDAHATPPSRPEDDVRGADLPLPVHPGTVASLLEAVEAVEAERDAEAPQLGHGEASSGSSDVGDLTGSSDETADRER